MSVLIPPGVTAVDSGDFTLTEGGSATLHLTAAAGPAVDVNASALIQIKDAEGEYFTVGTLSYLTPGVVVCAAGTYRVSKPASTVAFGVDKV